MAIIQYSKVRLKDLIKCVMQFKAGLSSSVKSYKSQYSRSRALPCPSDGVLGKQKTTIHTKDSFDGVYKLKIVTVQEID